MQVAGSPSYVINFSAQMLQELDESLLIHQKDEHIRTKFR